MSIGSISNSRICFVVKSTDLKVLCQIYTYWNILNWCWTLFKATNLHKSTICKINLYLTDFSISFFYVPPFCTPPKGWRQKKMIPHAENSIFFQNVLEHTLEIYDAFQADHSWIHSVIMSGKWSENALCLIPRLSEFFWQLWPSSRANTALLILQSATH